MRKILLVIDDFNELVGFETFFRRLGFDVLSLAKDLLVSDAILGFVPDLVIATGKGRSVDGIKLAAKLKRNTPPPRVALIFPSGQNLVLAPESQAIVDAMIEVPSQPRSILKIVAQLVGLDPGQLVEKFERLGIARANAAETKRIFGDGKGSEGHQFVTGGSTVPGGDTPVVWDPEKTPGLASTARSPRSDRYDKFLAEHDDDVSNTIPRQQMAAATKKLKDESEKEKPFLDQLDEDKRKFAKALFSDGKKPKK